MTHPCRFTYLSNAARSTSDNDSPRSSATALARNHNGSATRMFRSLVPTGTSDRLRSGLVRAILDAVVEPLAILGNDVRATSRTDAPLLGDLSLSLVNGNHEAVPRTADALATRKDIEVGDRASDVQVATDALPLAGGRVVDGGGSAAHVLLRSSVCRYSLTRPVGTGQAFLPTFSGAAA